MNVPGQPRRSMYGERNTHDEQVALTAAAFQRLADSAFWLHASESPVDLLPIRVVATIGKPIQGLES